MCGLQSFSLFGRAWTPFCTLHSVPDRAAFQGISRGLQPIHPPHGEYQHCAVLDCVKSTLIFCELENWRVRRAIQSQQLANGSHFWSVETPRRDYPWKTECQITAAPSDACQEKGVALSLQAGGGEDHILTIAPCKKVPALKKKKHQGYFQENTSFLTCSLIVAFLISEIFLFLKKNHRN